MPSVVGISLIDLDIGSPVTIHIQPTISDGDSATGRSVIQPILDVSDLSTTFSAIAEALCEETVQETLALPSHLTEPARKLIVHAAHKVPSFQKIWLTENIQLIRRQLHLDPDTPNRNELFIEITPNSLFARAEYTEVEDDIRSMDTLKEVFVSLPHSSQVDSGLVATLVDPIAVVLKTSPSPAGSDVKNIIITGGDEALLAVLSQKIRDAFIGGTIITFSSDYAQYAAKHALAKYQQSLNMGHLFITNVVPLRVGIAKADGFVLTALQRNSTLPQEQSLFLTTSTDNQITATIKIVVGISPVAKDNTPIAELVLNDLKSRPRGQTIIKVSFAVEHYGKTTIVAEELTEEGTALETRASIELEDVLGNDQLITVDGIEDALEGISSMKGDPGAVEAEDRWAGEIAQGDLPR